MGDFKIPRYIVTFELTNSGSIGCDHGFIHVADRCCRQIMLASSSRRDCDARETHELWDIAI